MGSILSWKVAIPVPSRWCALRTPEEMRSSPWNSPMAEPTAEAVADLVATAGAKSIGTSGYSSLGAVVGATKPDDARRLRERMPRQVFLVPGFGAQGGGVADVLPCFDSSGRGAIVSASRSVIYAFEGEQGSWKASIERAAARFATELSDGIA